MKEMKPCCNVRWAVAGECFAAGIADYRADVCGFIAGSMADCHSDGIGIDAGDAVSQTVTALRFATIVPGAYCWHHADDNEFESGVIKQ